MICPFLFVPIGLVLLGTAGEVVLKAVKDWKETHPNINHLNYKTKKCRTYRNYCG